MHSTSECFCVCTKEEVYVSRRKKKSGGREENKRRIEGCRKDEEGKLCAGLYGNPAEQQTEQTWS